MNKKAFLMQWFLFGQIFIGNKNFNKFINQKIDDQTIKRLDLTSKIKKGR